MMNVSKKLVSHGFKHVLDSKPVNTCYMVDHQGKEVQITTTMIRAACHQLLQRCRTIKN